MDFLNHFQKMESYLPVDLSTTQGLFISFFVIYTFIIVRYFLIVSPFYFYYWSPEKRRNSHYIHSGFNKKQVGIEIKYSLISSLIFAASGVLLGWLWQNNLTLIYLQIEAYGFLYLPASFLLLTLSHEVYFYLSHRWMHKKSVFKYIHSVHHLSKNTSPWASFSFHPGEAVILALFLPIIVLILPIHPLVLIAYMVFMSITAASNHLGVEIIRSPKILNYVISGSHHATHHHHYNANYGLYYRFMDQLFKTENTQGLK